MYSWFSGRSTPRGSSNGLVPAGPTQVKACKSNLFTEGTPGVEIKNTCLIQLTHYVCIWVTEIFFS